MTLRLWRVLKPRLAAESMTTVYETLERPMVAAAGADGERAAWRSTATCSRACRANSRKAWRGSKPKCSSSSARRSTCRSPKQLGDILFGQMGLPGGKKTATGAWSTSAGVLEDLAEQGHQLPARILDWRQLAKLKSTYTDALPSFVDPRTQRVHTSYALASTTTGRLSSSDPNLQNIPVRNEEGRKIRRAFVAAPGCKLISADYSQIELRLLAHVADIAALKKAFADGLDIHAMTASEMFGVPVKDMPGEVRRRAKAINFGIIYGISAFGLANQLGIPRDEAGAYIRKYFERFPGIRDYMEATKTAGARRRLRPHHLRPQVPLPAHQRVEPVASAPSTSARRSTRRCRAPPPTSSAAPWCAWTGRSTSAKLERPDADAGARRTGVRGARRRGRGDDRAGRRRSWSRRPSRPPSSASRWRSKRARRAIGTRRTEASGRQDSAFSMNTLIGSGW